MPNTPAAVGEAASGITIEFCSSNTFFMQSVEGICSELFWITWFYIWFSEFLLASYVYYTPYHCFVFKSFLLKCLMRNFNALVELFVEALFCKLLTRKTILTNKNNYVKFVYFFPLFFTTVSVSCLVLIWWDILNTFLVLWLFLRSGVLWILQLHLELGWP